MVWGGFVPGVLADGFLVQILLKETFVGCLGELQAEEPWKEGAAIEIWGAEGPYVGTTRCHGSSLV